MAINPVFFIGFGAGALQVIALRIGIQAIRQLIQEHRERMTWAHIKAQTFHS